MAERAARKDVQMSVPTRGISKMGMAAVHITVDTVVVLGQASLLYRAPSGGAT